MTVSYKKGQLVSIISVEANEGEAADTARNTYYATAIPLAERYGLSRDGQLSVIATPQGTHKPAAVLFFSFPSTQAEQDLIAHPDWPTAKALRPAAWKVLRIYSDVVDDDLTLNFRFDKIYSLAVAWINPEKPNDYSSYLNNIEPAVTASGGRFMHKVYDPRFEAHDIAIKLAPGQLTFVEWDSPSGLQAFQKTQGFKDNAALLGSGTTRFELMLLKAL